MLEWKTHILSVSSRHNPRSFSQKPGTWVLSAFCFCQHRLLDVDYLFLYTQDPRNTKHTFFWLTWAEGLKGELGVWSIVCCVVVVIRISLTTVNQSQPNFMCSFVWVGDRLHIALKQVSSKLWFPWHQKGPIDL